MYKSTIHINHEGFPRTKKNKKVIFSVQKVPHSILKYSSICESRSEIISVEIERYRRYQEERQQPAWIPPVTSTGCVIYFHSFFLLFTTCVCVCVIGSALTYDLGDSLGDDSRPNFPTS